MKKLLILIVIAFTINTNAQESTLLRLKYQKGDKYIVTTKSEMTSEAMSVDATLTTSLIITESNKESFNSEIKFTRVVMDMEQGANVISYDSSKSDDELDQMGLMMKGQLSPMLSAVVTSKGNRKGKILESKSSQNFQGSENFSDGGVEYPTKVVRVGDTFNVEKTVQGATMKLEYKVTLITNNEVHLSMTGKVSGATDGTITGTLVVDKKSGVTKVSKITTNVSAMGQSVSTVVNTVTKKVN